MIFHQKKIFNWQFWLLCIISLLLIFSDKNRFGVPRIKPYIQMSMLPLAYAVILPARTFYSIRDYFIFQHELIHDKSNLQSQALQLQARLQELNALKAQNEELQSLLKTTPVEQKQNYILTRVISIKQENNVHETLVNAGSRDGIASGLPVVAGDGIVGQIIQTTPLNSRVMLLTDQRSAIPATNARTHNNLIVVGTGDPDDLALLNISNSLDVKPGDLLFSSGIGGHYPAGYPVGTVSAIDMNGKNMAKIHIKPAANLHRLHFLLIVLDNNSMAKLS